MGKWRLYLAWTSRLFLSFLWESEDYSLNYFIFSDFSGESEHYCLNCRSIFSRFARAKEACFVNHVDTCKNMLQQLLFVKQTHDNNLIEALFNQCSINERRPGTAWSFFGCVPDVARLALSLLVKNQNQTKINDPGPNSKRIQTTCKTKEGSFCITMYFNHQGVSFR